ncbi:NADPH-dependent FMN reductase [Micromonospora sp. WMMD1082]|uniref:NADPH-dependent FMN reductase n=1 Tax=Micromonospora sp. WMMD1082 TaxID=3016104 RepID=UPI002416F078|nr:NADPH-dependent FMN reductase [Micromonospora sp. WMMD1082]MDG4797620.1 NAD(P)H-dependent oxidoreductase [Micromonospora sp. WMMD1082]
MTDVPIRLAVIIGSVRAERTAPRVADWLLARLKCHADLDIDLLDLAGLDLPAAMDGTGDARVFADRIRQADAYLVLTPEYNHAYPGPLKTAIDSANQEWWAKPVAFVCYGGTSGGLRAVEQLRLVLAELHAVTLRHTVSFPNVWERFDAEGGLRDAARAEEQLDTLLAGLRWWSAALRTARAAAPYPG